MTSIPTRAPICSLAAQKPLCWRAADGGGHTDANQDTADAADANVDTEDDNQDIPLAIAPAMRSVMAT